MKYLALALLAVQPAFAGGQSSGGISPPALRGVVILELIPAGREPNAKIERIVRQQAASDLEGGSVEVFAQFREHEVNGFTRNYWCIQYPDHIGFLNAIRTFDEKLRGLKNVEVVSTNVCRTEN